MFGERGLDLSHFPAEILQKSLLQVSIGLSRFLADNAKALVQFFKDLLRDKCSSFYRLLVLWLLSLLSNLLIDFGLSFGPVSSIAEQHQKNFLCGSYWHSVPPAVSLSGGHQLNYASSNDAT